MVKWYVVFFLKAALGIKFGELALSCIRDVQGIHTKCLRRGELSCCVVISGVQWSSYVLRFDS